MNKQEEKIESLKQWIKALIFMCLILALGIIIMGYNMEEFENNVESNIAEEIATSGIIPVLDNNGTVQRVSIVTLCDYIEERRGG